jgi:ATP-dependent DNA helicase RecG
MNREELLELITYGKNSGVEFKRDDLRPEQLAREAVALANLEGGRILLGVDDDGTIPGIQRPDLEAWVMNVFNDKVHPFLIPFYEEIQMDNGKRVAVVSFPRGISKPYVLRHNNREEMYIRLGSTTRLATREQQVRLYANGGLLNIEEMPVSGTSFDSLDLVRLQNYMADILRDPDVPGTREEWVERAISLGFLKESGGSPMCTIAGLLLFGKEPRRYLRHSGIRIMIFDGEDKEYKARYDDRVTGPMTARFDISPGGTKTVIDEGLVERTINILKPFITEESGEVNEGLRRDKYELYPRDAIRETLINALIHRDWTRSLDIEIAAYNNRLEITSPGALPNGMTLQKMKAGHRSPRNILLVDIFRDYGYGDARGMGIRTKVIPLVKESSGQEPTFEVNEDFFRIVLPSAKEMN